MSDEKHDIHPTVTRTIDDLKARLSRIENATANYEFVEEIDERLHRAERDIIVLFLLVGLTSWTVRGLIKHA